MAIRTYPVFHCLDFPTQPLIEHYFNVCSLNNDILNLKAHQFYIISPAYSPTFNPKTQIIYNNSSIWGIDIPTLLRRCDEKKEVVVIIGIEPLRSIKDFGTGYCIVGTPYALHMGANYSKGVFGRELVDAILNQTPYNVYCTDLLKFYSANATPNGQISNYKNYIADNNLETNALNLLSKELVCISKQYGIKKIIVFGNEIKQRVSSICSGYPVDYYPHFPCRPQTGWYVYPPVESGKHKDIIRYIVSNI